MTHYILGNNLTVQIQQYNISHAESISKNLFDGLQVDIIIQQREQLLAPGPEEVYSVCCILEEMVIGVCTGVRKRWFGERHRIEMVQVVVKDEFRGLGIARFMMAEIAKHFKKYEVEIVQISVEATNANAIAAYERIGFVRFGVLENGLRHNDKYFDEIMMSARCMDLIEKQ